MTSQILVPRSFSMSLRFGIFKPLLLWNDKRYRQAVNCILSVTNGFSCETIKQHPRISFYRHFKFQFLFSEKFLFSVQIHKSYLVKARYRVTRLDGFFQAMKSSLEQKEESDLEACMFSFGMIDVPQCNKMPRAHMKRSGYNK